MRTLVQDLRYAARMITKSPGFTAIAVLTLALGIGANTAIFSVVYGVLLRPLPYPHPGRIARLAQLYKGQLDEDGFTAQEFRFWQAHSQPFQHLAAITGGTFTLAGGSQPQRVTAERVSADYFQVMGVQPFLGRGFSPDEDKPGGPNAVVLTYALWKSNFGGDPSLVGKNIHLDGASYAVIGVMPKGFEDVAYACDLWTTIAQVDAGVGGGENYRIVGRLAPGVARDAADRSLTRFKGSYMREFKPGMPAQAVAGMTYDARPLQFALSENLRAPLYILFGAIGFVLLIACVNLANLLLARSGSRIREMAVRTAIGATRPRLIRQLLTESLLLAILGGALGLFLAVWGLQALLALAPPHLPRTQEIRIDDVALAFTSGIAILAGILFGLAPAFRGSKTDLHRALKEGAAQAGSGRHHRRLGSVLATSEIALSLVLLIGAGLLTKTFATLLSTDPGFDPHNVLSLQVWTTGTQYDSMPATAELYRGIVAQVDAVPGVRSAAMVAAGAPLQNGGNFPIATASDTEHRAWGADYREITPGYFRTLGARLIAGREFTDQDSAGAPLVAIVNQRFLRNLPDRDPLRERLIRLDHFIGPQYHDVELQIVGVVSDTKSEIDSFVRPTVFIPVAQANYQIDSLFQGFFPVNILVRTARDPLALSRSIESAVRRAAPGIPIGEIRSMEQVLGVSLAFQRFLMLLMSIFAALALALAAVGIYGVMSYSVAQRTHEIGIRMALGAGPLGILALILRHGVMVIAAGTAAGIGAAIGLTRLLASQLYGVQPRDPTTFTVVALALAAVAFAACYIPARRAMRLDPLAALREE